MAVLGPNSYGKAGIRVVRVERGVAGHELVDLEVSVALSGELTEAHLHGENAAVLPTDTQKNTVHAFARDPIASIEEFALRLARHFVDTQAAITRARIEVARFPWVRTEDARAGTPHSFRRDGSEVRTAVVEHGGGGTLVASGIRDLVVLNTTGSEFAGFAVDGYTTLAPTGDRILATAIEARWRCTEQAGTEQAGTEQAGADAGADAAGDADGARFARVRECLLAAFVGTYSHSLQETLFAMGARVIDEVPDIAEVRLALPNRHHLPVDLAPFGRDNPGVVYVPADRPYGLIEGTVLRDGALPDPRRW